MNRRQVLDRTSVSRRLLVADWPRLMEWEQDQVIELARREGRRAARWFLAEAIDGNPEGASLRNCRWAQTHADLAQLDDALFYLYASAQTLASEDDYFTGVIEAFCPERADWWWQTPREDRLEDPRVCAFCDGYERERCRILGLVEPPTSITDLQQYLSEAKEHERSRGREWLSQTEERALSEAEESQQFVVRWEYQRCSLATDLAQMLLDAAFYHARLR